ncbi:hypothetical protein ACI68E_002599 [Malassezia pachydermatis]
MYLPPSPSKHLYVRDYHTVSATYDDITISHIERGILTTMDKVAKTARVTLIIDSLDALLDATGCRINEAYSFLRRILQLVPRMYPMFSPQATRASWPAMTKIHPVLPRPL